VSVDDASKRRRGGGPLLVVVSGPSGVGKDSLLLRMRDRGVDAHYTTTVTTRPKREVDPADHEFLSFVTDDDFQQLLQEGGLLEHAQVYAYRYGVPKRPLQEALARGRDVIVRVDVQGAETIKRLIPAAISVFLAPPSMTQLEARLRARKQDGAAAVQRRLNAAERELAQAVTFDHVVVNEEGRLDEAVDQVLNIMERERARAGRQPAALK
jgi:guanylate kinase